MNNMKKWYYTYVLRSLKNKRFYKGYTSNLQKRLIEHNLKRGSKYSMKNAPFELIFFEAYKDKKDAIAAEKFFKTGYGSEVLKQKIKNYLVHD